MIKYTEPLTEEEKEDILAYIKSEPDIIDCLKTENLRDLYEIMNEPYKISVMTQLLYDSGIDIFTYLDYVPAFAFWESSIEEVEIPKHIFEIENNAFAYSDHLKKVTFEEGSCLDAVGTYAFKSCHNLANEIIVLPDSLTKLEGCAFDHTNIKYLSIPLGTEVYSKSEAPIVYRGVD